MRYEMGRAFTDGTWETEWFTPKSDLAIAGAIGQEEAAVLEYQRLLEDHGYNGPEIARIWLHSVSYDDEEPFPGVYFQTAYDLRQFLRSLARDQLETEQRDAISVTTDSTEEHTFYVSEPGITWQVSVSRYKEHA